MRRWLGARYSWVLISNRVRQSPVRYYSTNSKPTSSTSNSGSGGNDGSLSKYGETYRQLENLDFMTAAKILFGDSPKKKKFGLDFHLVQLFFACMPSLAVYLVAKYARYEMRRMDAELEVKKKAEEEAAKAKEDELKASEETEQSSNPDLSEVKERLNKLEEAVKEIVVESKKKNDETSKKSPTDGTERKDEKATKNSKTEVKSEATNSRSEDQKSKQEVVKNTDQTDASS